MAKEKKAAWKQRLVRELTSYWINFVYLALFFGAFTFYRRLVLSEYGIGYFAYGAALLKALILAKVILVGDALHLGRRSENMPLIYPTLYKAVLFTLFVGAFEIVEHAIAGEVRGTGVVKSVDKVVAQGLTVLFAKSLTVFCAFIPFFAFRELGRVLGEGKLGELFFRKHTMKSAAPCADAPQHPAS